LFDIIVTLFTQLPSDKTKERVSFDGYVDMVYSILKVKNGTKSTN